MGFFSMKAVCSVCGNECGLNRFQIADKGWVCPSCFKAAGLTPTSPVRTMTVEDIKAAMVKRESDAEDLSSFAITQEVGGYLKIDENAQRWYIPDGFAGKTKHPHIYSFADIVDYELIEDGSSVAKGGLGRAVVGGAVFGGVGAIVGGVTGKRKSSSVCEVLELKITLCNMNAPTAYIKFIETSTKKSGPIYKMSFDAAQKCLALFRLMCDKAAESESTGSDSGSQTAADEIMKFKQLLDAGAITEEEYNAKKKQLLGL